VRLRVLTLVVALALLAVPPVVFAPASQALGTCPTGTTATRLAGSLACLDLAGNARGYLVNGSYTESVFAAKPVALTQPSSVLAAGGGAGGTPGQNANLAGAMGDPANGGRVMLGTRVLQYGTAFVTAGVTGYMVGQGVAKLGCSFGVDDLCIPSDCSVLSVFTGCTGAAVVPDADVVVTGDPGWQLPASLTVSGGAQLVAPSQSGGISGQTFGEPSIASGDTMLMVLAKPTGSTAAFGFEWGASCADAPGTLAAGAWGAADVTGTANGTVTGAAWSGSTYSGPVGAGGVSATYAAGPVGSSVLIAGSSLCSAHGGLGRLYLALKSGTGAVNYDLGQPWRLAYTFPGDPLRPVGQDPDPARTLVASNTCTLSGGGTTTTTASSASFTEGSDPATWPAFPTPPGCPPGSTLAGSKVVETTPGLPDQTIWSVSVPGAVTDWQQTDPQCGDGSCRLGLWKINGTEHLNCFAGSTGCADWFQDPNKAADYVCTYGVDGASVFAAAQAVDLAQCNVYAPTFDVQKNAQGIGYGDPGTGADPATDPGTDPGSLPGAGGASCWPSGWSAFNPAEWVLQPLQCAFIPDPGKIADLKTTVTGGLGSSGLGPWFTAIGGFFSLADNNGCQGPEVTFPLSELGAGADLQLHPVDACADPLKSLAAISRALSTVVILFAGGLACLNAITAAFGYRGDSAAQGVAP
jgi:hypothetical protein